VSADTPKPPQEAAAARWEGRLPELVRPLFWSYHHAHLPPSRTTLAKTSAACLKNSDGTTLGFHPHRLYQFR